ncbi:ATP-binding cassette domain-containing protein [Lactobacillus delbrueckii subsp. bulgaricus]|nr:ATP-binding cassette domain-containing protein [Lactobacillus delbrueckii subsp. bulgaricus]MCD5479985.1 ATP-binding cassette domain-containing protein [Lactobacillus delbrueckii subsp. bulgaricus]MCT3517083.1 ATP-binding cassette domain-containing protein [Lactobacillus delbrueckii subsp. bulgaricus]MCT3518642.1 ATP-binding cassette domain-containing protein [Lactobacillus delbrueckii subsp. bulgaricus]
MAGYLSSLSFLDLAGRLPASVAQGLFWGIMALGVYITFRILDIADLTVDGTFATGGAVSAVLIMKGVNHWLAVLVALVAGLLSGGQRQVLTLLMATLVKPKVLLLDEHTAALDPKTAEKVLKATDRIVAEGKLTTIMVTHNMRDAIAHGNRLIMMNDGKVVLDIKGEEKKKLTVEKLLHQFEVVSGEEFASDKAILG